MKKTTIELFEMINKSKNLNQLLSKTSPDLLQYSLSDYLNQLLTEKGLVKSDVIFKSNLNPHYAYQIFNNTKKDPSRDKLLSLSVGMSLSPDETQNLLKVARQAPLYPREQRDLVILFALKEHYTMISLNEILQDLNLKLLV